ncbi:MAG: DUF4389 domain-containing protein [Dehalococcoidia bacterium]
MSVDADAIQPRYPVQMTMEYPERVSRLSTAFRILLVIPVLIFLALVGGGTLDAGSWGEDGARMGGTYAGGIAGGIVLAIWATILVRGNIPHWLFDFQVGLNRFTFRAYSYVALLTDKYPAFEGDWALNYDVVYPDRLSRWKLLFWKLITSIPHFIVLLFLVIAAVVVVIIGWFAILFTGAFPRGLHAFVVGVLRWGARVEAYFQSLTDEFPPYSLEEDAGPGSDGSMIASAIIGGLIMLAGIAGAVALAVFLFIYLNDSKTSDVDLQDALAGSVAAEQARIELDGEEFTLMVVADPADVENLRASEGKRLVEAVVSYLPDGDRLDDEFTFGPVDDDDIERDTLRLKTDDGTEDPVLLTFDGVVAPLDLDSTIEGDLRAVFEIDEDAIIEELRAYTGEGERHVAWEFD